MENQNLAITAILSAAVLIAAVVAVASPMTVYADYGRDGNHKKFKKDAGDTSTTDTNQKLKQKNVGSGYSGNTNCGQNTIHSLAIGVCPDATVTVED